MGAAQAATSAPSAADKASAEAEVKRLCASQTGAMELRRKLVDEVMPGFHKRVALVNHLRAGGGDACQTAVVSYLKDLADGKPHEKGHVSLLVLGVSADLSGISAALENEIVGNRGAGFLDSLHTTDKEVYARTLRTWLSSAAAKVRAEQSLALLPQDLYGHATLTDADAKRSAVRPTAPLVFERFLKLMNEEKHDVSAEEFQSVNVLFASATPSYREVFLPMLTSAAQAHQRKWLDAFRLEPPWVQTRLVPILERVGGPEMVRELMWLSTYHKDLRVRALASSALDNVLARAGETGKANR